ncbi:HU family DNA-binding protein [Candidatus Azobacteroides pseudotrichonymphae]|uniref:Uncharacterized protein n=1 Tax=Azobacteroides pseudotrichonymphae genomovar. CFP2 TaxID=511995 RepID=B6YRY0_AZOPC|nr:HU family DNA-binding protein [Candidatus Azobacteroides pseudotrichonymphae]BAG83952.1 hypothetical protein CFPG_689 [Candidatus Azobacteroides pseudotrichonymphae genomovar. CFP2]
MDKVKMNAGDIIRSASRASGYSRRVVKEVFQQCIEEMKETLLSGKRVSLKDFLSLTLGEYTVKPSGVISPSLIGIHPRVTAHLYSQYKRTIKENGQALRDAILARKEAIQNDPLTKRRIEQLSKINPFIKKNKKKRVKRV